MAQQLLINNNGGNGSTGSAGFPFGPYGGDGSGGTPGGTANNSTTGNITFNSAPAAISTGNGGRGGDGGNDTGVLSAIGGNGANGSQGGNITLNNGFAINVTGAGGSGLVATTIGGGGGFGGDAVAGTVGVGGAGGTGGNGGAATINNSGSITTTGVSGVGILVQSDGGRGGESGTGTGVGGGFSKDGGGGGAGGTATGGNSGQVQTSGDYAYGMLVRAAGGVAGAGSSGNGLLGGSGGNGGPATVGGFATGDNSGSIITFGNFASGMVVQSIGGAGGDGGGAFGLFGGGGSGTNGNDGRDATGTNTGTIQTNGQKAIGILIESVGGGGGDGGGAAGLVALGGTGAGGGIGGTARGNLSGTVRTGVDGSGEGAKGIVVQSVGGGGGNGGFSVSPPIAVASVAVGGNAGGGGAGGNVIVRDVGGDGPTVFTRGAFAGGILAQSVGGGGGNGGGALSVATISVAVGGTGGGGGDGGIVDYNVVGADVTTRGVGSTGVTVQSIGGGGGNGGFGAAASGLVAIAVGGSAGNGGAGKKVDAISGTNIDTDGDVSHGLLVQSVGGGGGTGGTAGAFTASLASVSVAVGGGGGKGGDAGEVNVTHNGNITVRGAQSKAIIVQSIGGGGGVGGDAWAGAFSASPWPTASVAVGVGGSGGDGGSAKDIKLTASGILQSLSAGDGTGGIVAQSIGGGGGIGGSSAVIAGSLSPTVAVSVGVSVGGAGGVGGSAGKVVVDTLSGSILVRGANAVGILAQSIGGGGGAGGNSWGATGGYGNSVTVNATIGIGGKGGNGKLGQNVDVTNRMAITMEGDGINGAKNNSAAIKAQSIGGGGGSGGAVNGATASVLAGGVNVDAKVTVGGSGGTGNNSGIVTVKNFGTLNTFGQFSSAIIAQSIGGGGGDGGASNADSFRANGGSRTNVSATIGVGGFGGAGGDGNTVLVENSASIRTRGLGSHGILAMSIGGGGGSGGASSIRDRVLDLEEQAESINEAKATNSKEDSSSATSISIGVGIAGFGAGAGVGKKVEVINKFGSTILTERDDSNGISAHSIGGSGGIGAAASAASKGTISIGGTLGGFGGAGGEGGEVVVTNEEATNITTRGRSSIGILAQSIGGGGGSGGAGMSTGDGSADVNLQLSIGGFGAAGGFGNTVTVTNRGTIETLGRYSHAIMAQSIGGSGGVAGAAGATTSGSNISIAFALGGFGGSGGQGGNVTVDNFAVAGSNILTRGSNASGIFAQSVGGGGGFGGAGTTKADAKSVAVDLTIGGGGGTGNFGGLVTVRNTQNIETRGVFSHGVFAQSIGGGGGASGAAANSSKSEISVGARLAVPAGDASFGGAVSIDNDGSIVTSRNHSVGLFAQSVGGSGGAGGAVTSSTEVSNVSVDAGLGGFGGQGGYGGKVDISNKGFIFTKGDHSHAIFAQSVGGGGGAGGSTTNEVRGVAAEGGSDEGIAGNADKDKEEAISIALALGGKGGGGSYGGNVSVTNSGNLVTRGVNAIGIFAESIGGGGGASGIAGNKLSGGKIAIGGAAALPAGGGQNGGSVTVNNTGFILTFRDGGIGIFAHSIGGGGGAGGAVTSELKGSDFAIGFDMGGFGGAGGHGGNVLVNNLATAALFSGVINTSGDNAHGIFAQSVGGGGGTGGTSTSKLTAEKESDEENGGDDGDGIAISATLGGIAGDGNFGGTVDVSNSGLIRTSGKFSHAIYAESVGGGGGTSGAANNTSTANFTIGAATTLISGGGASGGNVTVDNRGVITTLKDGSIGIFAHSVGGGGGSAGAASTEASSTGNAISFAMGGFGGNAGNGGTVIVRNFSGGLINTFGHNAHGIFAQSVGGGGGLGGASTSNSSATDLAVTANLGGIGGSGAKGGSVTVENDGRIRTSGSFAHGVFAESIGGGGGASGSVTQSTSATTNIGAAVSLFAGSGSDGGGVIVNNRNQIITLGQGSHGVFAHSVGGGGGFGASVTSSQKPGDLGVAMTLGGKGSGGGAGGAVTVTNSALGQIDTFGMGAYGIFAQSVGGGGGAGGSASLGFDGEEGKANAFGASMGGLAGAGNNGGTVKVNNAGLITTRGDLAHGIFAESIGGGGGASGAASLTSKAEFTVGASISIIGGGAANGGYVEVKNSGIIETLGNGALGIFAQSIGGGGGFGGVSSTDLASENDFGFALGGSGAAGGNGGNVLVDVSGAIITRGERAHGVVAQSVGGGGGYAGDAGGKTNNQLAIGGFGGNGGNGGDVTVIRTGEIITLGKDSIAIIAQSVGGGGGIGGAGFGRIEKLADEVGINGLGFNSPDGSKGNGGKVEIIQTGEIATKGDRAHGVVAQAVGGSGGFGGSASLALGQSGAGSNGGIGDANDVAATVNNQVFVEGKSAYALFGQSATGVGNSGKVDLKAESNLIAQGKDSVAVYGESTSLGDQKNITIRLNGRLTAGGSDTGVAAMLVGGVDNTIFNHSLTYATGLQLSENQILAPVLANFSALTMSGTTGNDRIENQRLAGTLGRIIGNVELRMGLNSVQNYADASFVGLTSIGLGGGTFLNDGLMTNSGIGVLSDIALNGAYTQSGTGDFITDIDLNNQDTDALNLTGVGNFAGEAKLNFISIDKLFDEYVVSKGSSMTDAGIIATTARPTVGFDFKFRVDSGTNLVLFADKPTFVDMLSNPSSGVTDDNTFSMAKYLDSVEAASSPANPMARLINMLRFLPDEETLGDTLVRLTPHYAVHAMDMANRSIDMAINASDACLDDFSSSPLNRCVWFNITPDVNYGRSIDSGISQKDKISGYSLGGLFGLDANYSVGGSIFISNHASSTAYQGELLSEVEGDTFQAYGIGHYENGPWSVTASLGGGVGRQEGLRDTTVDQAAFTPGETVGGIYLQDRLLDGISAVTLIDQKTSQFGLSVNAAYRFGDDALYFTPAVQFDARWIGSSVNETGSLAAMKLDGSSTLFAITPNVEAGFSMSAGNQGTLTLFAKGGIRAGFGDWQMGGGFAAAQGLAGVEPLKITEKVDSPLFMFGAGVRLTNTSGSAVYLNYEGLKSKDTEQHAFKAGFNVKF